MLTHWGRATHICVGKLTIIGSDNGLSPGRRQAIIWTNPGILLIGPLGTNFSEILIGIQTFSFRKMHLKVSSGKWRPFCLGLNELNESMHSPLHQIYSVPLCSRPDGIIKWGLFPSYILCLAHQIPKLKCVSSRLTVVFAHSIEARC